MTTQDRDPLTALDDPDLLEMLAALEHDERWGDIHPSGETYNARWDRLALTPYRDLSERDKESDRVEVRKSLAVIKAYLAARAAGQEGGAG